jgi:hypothetical protein
MSGLVANPNEYLLYDTKNVGVRKLTANLRSKVPIYFNFELKGKAEEGLPWR